MTSIGKEGNLPVQPERDKAPFEETKSKSPKEQKDLMEIARDNVTKKPKQKTHHHSKTSGKDPNPFLAVKMLDSAKEKPTVKIPKGEVSKTLKKRDRVIDFQAKSKQQTELLLNSFDEEIAAHKKEIETLNLKKQNKSETATGELNKSIESHKKKIQELEMKKGEVQCQMHFSTSPFISNPNTFDPSKSQNKEVQDKLKQLNNKISDAEETKKDKENVFKELSGAKNPEEFLKMNLGDRKVMFEELSGKDGQKISTVDLTKSFEEYKKASNNLNEAKKKLGTYEKKTVPRNQYEEFSAALIENIPDIRINTSLRTSSSARAHDINNNGLKLSPKDTFEPDGSTVTINRDGKEVTLAGVKTAIIDGKTYDFTKSREGRAYLEDGILYSNKVDARYHDAVLASKTVITLCDGSGHLEYARTAAQDASRTSHEYLTSNLDACTTTHEAQKVIMNAVKIAADTLKQSHGSTTYIQTAILGNMLFGASVGDSAAFVFRPQKEGGWTAINILGNTKGTLDASRAGGQLSNESELERVHNFAFQLEPGDVVYVCSDGVVDNLDPSTNNILPNQIPKSKILSDKWEDENPTHISFATRQISKNLEEIVKKCKSGEEINDEIGNFVQDNAKDKKLNFMTNPNSQEMDCKGKLDDAASAYIEYKP